MNMKKDRCDHCRSNQLYNNAISLPAPHKCCGRCGHKETKITRSFKIMSDNGFYNYAVKIDNYIKSNNKPAALCAFREVVDAISRTEIVVKLGMQKSQALRAACSEAIDELISSIRP